VFKQGYHEELNSEYSEHIQGTTSNEHLLSTQLVDIYFLANFPFFNPLPLALTGSGFRLKVEEDTPSTLKKESIRCCEEEPLAAFNLLIPFTTRSSLN
jgi:hypothetical protein